MKTQFIYTAACIICPLHPLYAAGLERTDQSISAFLEPGNYAEINLAVIDAHIEGEVQYKDVISELGINDFSTGNLAEREFLGKLALKFQPHPQISAGLIYEQPYMANISYDYSPALPDGSVIDIESANISFKSNSLTGLIGYQPHEHWNIYGGLSWQSFKGELKIAGQQYDALNGYDAHFKNDNAVGWLAGLSYQRPEYGIKTSITYRSKIKHKNSTSESTFYSNGPFTIVPETQTAIETPQSVNFEFQTGISPSNLMYGAVRWVNWQNFVMQPPQLGAVLYWASQDPQYRELAQLKLISYKKDQWSGKLGIAHQWNSQWLTALEFVWDKGSGNPASTLNPSDGYRGLGLGIMYRFNPQTFLASGAYYLQFNKPDISSTPLAPQISGLSTVADNDAMVYGLKVGHHF